MKYDNQKAFPYPILSSNKEYSDDYPASGFQARIALKPDESGECAVMTARFELSEESILKCIEQKTATYGVHVLCTKTNYRRLIRSSSKIIDGYTFKENELYDKVVLMGCVVCTESVQEYQSKNFHEELSGQKYDMPMGGVLAIAEPETYYVDPQMSRPLVGVFDLMKDKNIKDTFQYDIEGETIVIKMSESEYARFNALREDSETQLYAIMSVYYPVLVEVLRAMATDKDGTYSNKKWYRAIDHRLQHFHIKLNSDNDEKIYIHAQQLMEYPLTKLPAGE